MLHLTFVAPVREPGFSRTEALDLARRIEQGFDRESLQCPSWSCAGRIKDGDRSPREVAIMVAALRTYAGE